MARRSKGARTSITLRVSIRNLPLLEADVRKAFGNGGLFQFLADKLCIEYGRPDLVRELRIADAQKELPLTR